jgi:hypothetical protein
VARRDAALRRDCEPPPALQMWCPS